jgi:hypothetical protein
MFEILERPTSPGEILKIVMPQKWFHFDTFYLYSPSFFAIYRNWIIHCQ